MLILYWAFGQNGLLIATLRYVVSCPTHTKILEWYQSSGGEQKVAFDIPWNVGQPDGLDAQNCIIFGYSQDERWNDMECTDKFRYICEF